MTAPQEFSFIEQRLTFVNKKLLKKFLIQSAPPPVRAA
jgi:hypothetical protein